MAEFHIPTWKYNYIREVSSDGSFRTQEIQVPYSRLDIGKLPIVARCLDGIVASEVVLIHDLSTIIDDLGRPSCLSEAHGVTAGPSGEWYPIWIVEDRSNITMEPPYEMDVFDLQNHTRLKINSCKICWVPHLEDSDGNFITLLINDPKLSTYKTKGLLVLIQELGNPQATRLAWRTFNEVRVSCRELDSNTKKVVFDKQLAALQACISSDKEISEHPWTLNLKQDCNESLHGYKEHPKMTTKQQLVRFLPRKPVQEQLSWVHSRFESFRQIFLTEHPVITMHQLKDLENYAANLLQTSNPPWDRAQVMVLLVVGISSYHDDVCQDYEGIIKQLNSLLVEPPPSQTIIHTISLVWATWLLNIVGYDKEAEVFLSHATALMGFIPIANRGNQYRVILQSTQRLGHTLKKAC